MKKSQYICLVLITAALASCNKQEREPDGWYVDVDLNWLYYPNHRHWHHGHFHNSHIAHSGFGHSGHSGGHA